MHFIVGIPRKLVTHESYSFLNVCFTRIHAFNPCVLKTHENSLGDPQSCMLSFCKATACACGLDLAPELVAGLVARAFPAARPPLNHEVITVLASMTCLNNLLSCCCACSTRKLMNAGKINLFLQRKAGLHAEIFPRRLRR